MVTIKKIISLQITMFSKNKSKSNTNINKRKNSAALAAKKESIDFLCIENSCLNFISTDVSVDSSRCISAEVPPAEVPPVEFGSQLGDYSYGPWRFCTHF